MATERRLRRGGARVVGGRGRPRGHWRALGLADGRDEVLRIGESGVPSSVGQRGTTLALLEILDIHLECRLNLRGACLARRPALVVVHKREPREVGAVIATHLVEELVGLGDNPDSLAALVVHNREDPGAHLAVDAANVAALEADDVTAEDRLHAEVELWEHLTRLALNGARVELHRESRGVVERSPGSVHRVLREGSDVEVRLHPGVRRNLDQLDRGASLALDRLNLVALGANHETDVAVQEVVSSVKHELLSSHNVLKVRKESLLRS